MTKINAALMLHLPALVGEAQAFTRVELNGCMRRIVSLRALREAGYRLRLDLRFTGAEMDEAMKTLGCERIQPARRVQYDLTRFRSI